MINVSTRHRFSFATIYYYYGFTNIDVKNVGGSKWVSSLEAVNTSMLHEREHENGESSMILSHLQYGGIVVVYYGQLNRECEEENPKLSTGL